MWDKVKSAAKWVYDWLVMIVALIGGALSVGVDIVSSLSGQDIAAFVPAPTAMKIVAGIAMLKTIVETYRSRKAA